MNTYQKQKRSKMNTKILTGSLFVLGLILMNGCYYDEIATFEGLPTNVSFKNDVMPIFDQNCNNTGCHDAIESHPPSLVYDNAYDALVLGNFINVLDPEKSKVYQVISTGEMPPSGALDANDQKILLGWIAEGAKEN